jgi:hypothetical protein
MRLSTTRSRICESLARSGSWKPRAIASRPSLSIELISPLWPRVENICARSARESVFVEYRA